MACKKGKKREERKMKDEQQIEVNYNHDIVEEDLKATAINDESMLLQDETNEDSVEELLGEGAELNEYTEVN